MREWMPHSLFRGTLFTLVTLVAAAAPALAQPDILYGDIHETLNHGAMGGIRAYSLGTKTCNIGNQSLSWVSSGTPAVGFNMYRLANGRLMQIGLGFAKHACCVSNGTDQAACGAFNCSASGFGLRPGCRDTYSASWNGGQGRLGARSGINAYSGAFTALPGGSGDAIFRRMQVRETDLATPSSLYFVEGVYVCTEEGTTMQALNNASYRRVTVSASPYNLTLQESNYDGIPAIQAWRDHGLGVNTPDTSVDLFQIDVPSEGRFWLAQKVTNLGGGNYRYDYAVFNLNSDRSAGSFTIPLPAGAPVNNAGFNAPFYHSGEVYSNDPWIIDTSVSGQLTWRSPQTFSVNPNTNALRWGTMYNFWFETNRPPTTGAATLGLFKPHTPQSIAINVQVPGGCGGIMGDINASTGVDGDDTQHFVSCLLNGSTLGGDCACADMNLSGSVTTDDVPDFVNKQLGL